MPILMVGSVHNAKCHIFCGGTNRTGISTPLSHKQQYPRRLEAMFMHAVKDSISCNAVSLTASRRCSFWCDCTMSEADTLVS